MPYRYQSPWMQDFAAQLLRGPKRLRLRQLLGVEFVLSVVESGRQYPGDFVQHALTGFRNPAAFSGARNGDARHNADTLISADALRGDLAQLAEQLSEDAALPLEAYDGRLYSIEDLAERFDVSTKTIFRWRRRGLVGWKFRCQDRRLRVVFADRCVRRFVAENAALVQRGRSFSQLSPVERQQIVDRATALVGQGSKTANAVARVISEETGRAVETIRLILRAHDESHPGAGVFNRANHTLCPDDQRLAVWSAYCDGEPIEHLAARFERPAKWIYRAVTQMRALELQRDAIEFQPSAEFSLDDADGIILQNPAVAQPHRVDAAAARAPANLPPYLQQLFRLPLLSAEGEVALFRKFNYLKFLAEQQRAAIDPETASAVELDRLEALLAQSAEVKQQITQANLRLVVSIAKRHAAPHLDFFEVVSDGNVSLMRAVDKFDYTRGFKFSTYASWAIIKNYARSVPEENTHRDRYQTGKSEFLEKRAANWFLDDDEDEQRAAVRAALERMLQILEERDRAILMRRFGIDNHGEPQTLEEIGRSLGVSKERVRQLESRAMGRLRAEFETDVTSLLSAS